MRTGRGVSMREDLAIRLENLRDKFGYSQREMSEKLGYTNNVYGMYERQERTPGYETVAEIAKIYHVSPDYLISGKSDNAYEEIATLFANHGIKNPAILQPKAWAALSYEDLICIDKYFEWIVYEAKKRK